MFGIVHYVSKLLCISCTVAHETPNDVLRNPG